MSSGLDSYPACEIWGRLDCVKSRWWNMQLWRHATHRFSARDRWALIKKSSTVNNNGIIQQDSVQVNSFSSAAQLVHHWFCRWHRTELSFGVFLFWVDKMEIKLREKATYLYPSIQKPALGWYVGTLWQQSCVNVSCYWPQTSNICSVLPQEISWPTGLLLFVFL